MTIPGLDPKDMTEVDSGGYVYLDEWIRGGDRTKRLAPDTVFCQWS